jgi:hypothetical protein
MEVGKFQMTTSNALSKDQADLLNRFYSIDISQVPLRKSARDSIWESFKKTKQIENEIHLLNTCPALVAELHKSIDTGNNVQSAVFSECVYAQTIANHFRLPIFRNQSASPFDFLKTEVTELNKMGLTARYTYSNKEETLILVQAGGSGGVDSALIFRKEGKVFAIEFKEPGAKTTEADLPKYGEDGFLKPSDAFTKKHPQFTSMIEEQFAKDLNFFEAQGSNINVFSKESLKVAVNGNYQGIKFADAICTEDSLGNLTIIPSDQIDKWATIEGEIRPAGRNPYKVWTPIHLRKKLSELGGKESNGTASLPMKVLVPAKPRGGTGISRYKIDSLFFVRALDVEVKGSLAVFNVGDVRQLNPTITAKMFFKNLNARDVKTYYGIK